MTEKSMILIIGGTGYLGKLMVTASIKAGHPTFVLVRESTISSKSHLINTFKDLGANIVMGDLYDHQSLVDAIQKVDVVISTVGYALLADQVRIIAAIKDVGNITRFFPSEFGNDVDRVHAIEPAKSMFRAKADFRRIVENEEIPYIFEKIPYTYVCSNFFGGRFLANLSQPGSTSPPKDKVTIIEDGTPKAIFNKEEDIATYTIRAVDDPRTLNKIMYIRPPQNIYSFNDLVSLWEKKIGKKLEKAYINEDQVVKIIQENGPPINMVMAISHSAFVKGDHTNFDINPYIGVEASKLYPDVKYTTVDEYLDQFV